MEPERRGPAPDGPARESPNRESRRGGSSLPVGGDSIYAFRVETKTALVLGGGGITGGMYELGALLFRADHPGTDLLMIEPSPAESSLFLYRSMNFAECVHFLERLAADRFLQQAADPVGRRRFGRKQQASRGPSR